MRRTVWQTGGEKTSLAPMAGIHSQAVKVWRSRILTRYASILKEVVYPVVSRNECQVRASFETDVTSNLQSDIFVTWYWTLFSLKRNNCGQHVSGDSLSSTNHSSVREALRRVKNRSVLATLCKHYICHFAPQTRLLGLIFAQHKSAWTATKW